MPSKKMARANDTEPRPSASSQLKQGKTMLYPLQRDRLLLPSHLVHVRPCLASKVLTRASSPVFSRSHHHHLALPLSKLLCRRRCRCQWVLRAWGCLRCKCRLRQCTVVDFPHHRRPGSEPLSHHHNLNTRLNICMLVALLRKPFVEVIFESKVFSAQMICKLGICQRVLIFACYLAE